MQAAAISLATVVAQKVKCLSEKQSGKGFSFAETHFVFRQAFVVRQLLIEPLNIVECLSEKNFQTGISDGLNLPYPLLKQRIFANPCLH